MNIQFLGELRWRSGGIAICFVDDDRFLSVDDEHGVQEFSLATGESRIVWVSEYESLNVLLPLGENRYFVGGSYGIGYVVTETPEGKWKLESEREMLSYFDCAAFAPQEQLVAVCCYDLVRLVPLDMEDPRQPVDVRLDKRRVFSIEWLASQQKFLIVSPVGLFQLALDGELTQVKTPAGQVLAATSVPHSNMFVCATGLGRTTTLFCARFDDPDELIWHRQFAQRTRLRSGYDKPLLSSDACLAYGNTYQEFVFACSASLRRLSLDGVLLQEIQLPYSIPGLQLSPNENYAVLANGFRQVMVVDRNGLQHLPRSCHRNQVSKLLFSADERHIFSLAEGCPEVHCWSVETGTRQWEFWSALDAATDLIHEHEGRVLCCREGDEVDGAIMSSLDENGGEKPLFALNGFDAKAVWFGPDRVIVVRKSFGKPLECQLRAFPPGRILSTTLLGEDKPRHVAVNGNNILIHDRSHIWVVNVNSPDKKYQLEPPTETANLSIFGENESTVTVVSETGVFRSSVSRRFWKKLVSFEIPVTAAGAVINGKIPIAFKGGNVEIRDVGDWTVLQQIPQPLGSVLITTCTLSNSEKYVAVGAYDGRIAVCTLASP